MIYRGTYSTCVAETEASFSPSVSDHGHAPVPMLSRHLASACSIGSYIFKKSIRGRSTAVPHTHPDKFELRRSPPSPLTVEMLFQRYIHVAGAPDRPADAKNPPVEESEHVRGDTSWSTHPSDARYGRRKFVPPVFS